MTVTDVCVKLHSSQKIYIFSKNRKFDLYETVSFSSKNKLKELCQVSYV